MPDTLPLIFRLDPMTSVHNPKIKVSSLQPSIWATPRGAKNTQASNLKPIFKLGLMSSRITHSHP